MHKQLLIFVCSLFTTLASAQTTFHANLGLALSQIDGDDIGGYKKPGYNIGAGFLFKKSDTYEIDYTLRLNQKGVRETNAYVIPLNYVENDLSFNYVYQDIAYVGVGLGLGYLANSSDQRRINNNIELARFDLFPLVNLGYKASDRVHIQTRFTRSLLPITKGGLKQDGFRWYNRSILFEFVWLFPSR